jgi:hypothetical protein
MTDQRDPAESKDPIEPAEPTDNTDKKEPTEPTDRAEPTEPIDRTDPLDAIDKTESSDHNDHSELEPVGPEAFSNLMFPSWRRRYGYRRPRPGAPGPPGPVDLVAFRRPRCRRCCWATQLATRSPFRHRMLGLFPFAGTPTGRDRHPHGLLARDFDPAQIPVFICVAPQGAETGALQHLLERFILIATELE